MNTKLLKLALLACLGFTELKTTQAQSLTNGNAYDKKISIASSDLYYTLKTNDTIHFYEGQSINITIRSLSATQNIKVPEVSLTGIDNSSYEFKKGILDSLKRPNGFVNLTLTFKDSVPNKIATLNFNNSDATNLSELSGIVLKSVTKQKGCNELFVDSIQYITYGYYDINNCSDSTITVSASAFSGSSNISLSFTNLKIPPRTQRSIPVSYTGKLGQKDTKSFTLTAFGDSIAPISKVITVIGEATMNVYCQTNKSFNVSFRKDNSNKGLLIKEGGVTPKVSLLTGKSPSMANNTHVGENTYYINLGTTEDNVISKIGTNSLKPNTQYSIAVVSYGGSAFNTSYVAKESITTNPEEPATEPSAMTTATLQTNDVGTLLKLTTGNGNGRLLILKKGTSSPNISGLVDGRTSFVPSDGSSILYLRSETEATISSLDANTTYSGKIVELNQSTGSSQCDAYYNYNKDKVFSFSFKTTQSQNTQSTTVTQDTVVNSLTTTNAVTFSKDTTLKNVTLKSGAVLTIVAGKTLTVKGNLVLEDGASIIDNGDVNVLTNITLKRNGTKSAGIYNYWSSPVESGNLASLGGNTYSYNEPGRIAGNYVTGWATATGAMTVGVGYTATATGAASFTGKLNTGTILIPVTRTAIDASVINDGWNLIGNPYPSELNLAKFLDTNTTLVKSAYYWDGSNYTTKNTGNIPSCQGFFVQAISSSTVKFSNKMRVGGATALFRTELQESTIIPITDNVGHSDQTQIDINTAATDGYDARYDAVKLKGNTNLQLYSKIGTDNFAINSLNSPAEGKIVYLGLDAIAGTFTIGKATAQLEGTDIYLNDKTSNKTINLSASSYTFTTNAVTGSNRFSLIIGSAVTTAIISNSNTNVSAIYVSNDRLFASNMPYGSSVTLFNTTGQEVVSGITSEEGLNVSGLEEGLYIVKASNATTSATSKIIVQ